MSSAPTPPVNGVHTLIGEVLARRNDPGSAAWTASVRRGLTPATEIGAYGATERHLVQVRETARTGARRAAAICAGARAVPHRSGSLGAGLARLDRAVGGSRVETRVGALPLLDVENAAQSLSYLVDLCAVHNVPLDFYDLADTLTWWGDGITPSSQQTRRRVIADYYGAPADPIAPADPAPSSTSPEGQNR